MASKQTLEEITSLALVLLRKEPESDRRRLLNWAENEMEKMGLHPHMTRTDNDTQAVADLIVYNVGLSDLMYLRNVFPTNVLQAEDFRDLIDRLTPGCWDETPLDSTDHDTDDEPGDIGVSVSDVAPTRVGDNAASAQPFGDPDPRPTSLEQAARGLKELFEEPATASAPYVECLTPYLYGDETLPWPAAGDKKLPPRRKNKDGS